MRLCLLGYYAPSVKAMLETVQVDKVSLPVAIGLWGMMWPVLAKVSRGWWLVLWDVLHYG